MPVGYTMRFSGAGRLLGREQEEVVAELADPVLEADEHFLEERVVDVGVLSTVVRTTPISCDRG